MHQCDSCHVKSTKENLVEMYRFRDKVYCTRCISLEGICILTTDTIFGVQPDRYLAPLMKDAILNMPQHGALSLTNLLESIKRQLVLTAKDQTMKERGNAILGTQITLTRLDVGVFLVSMTGTIVYSRYWDDMFVASNSFVAVADNEPAEPQYRVAEQNVGLQTPIVQSAPPQTPPKQESVSASQTHAHAAEPNRQSVPERPVIQETAPVQTGATDAYPPGYVPVPVAPAAFVPADESVVGKYPDVGGSTQMNRFRKLTEGAS